MRTALLVATALVALSSMAVAQDQLGATDASPKAKIQKVRINDQNAPSGGRLHYDVPCRVSPQGRCITGPPLYPLNRPRP